jgi:hypothetical protein
MFEWYSKLPDASKAALIGAFFGSSVTLIIAFTTILVKDYYIPVLAEKRAIKRLRKTAFKKYAHPIILCCSSFLFRLDEVLNQRAQYLLHSAPKTPFNDYKYISTVYRYCCLMGWLRAAFIEYSNLQVKNTKQYKLVTNAISHVEKSMADGQHVEEKVLNKICKIADLDISGLTPNKKAVLASKLEDSIMAFSFDNNATSAFSLSDEKKPLLVKKIVNELCKEMSQPEKNELFFSSAIVIECVDNMDWKEGLVYRDWQAAIGDIMIKVIANNDRKYDIMGYKEFEEHYRNKDDALQIWIKRAEKLFTNLNIKSNNSFDVRPQQLKRIFTSAYFLLQTYANLIGNDIKLAKDTLKRFEETYTSLCMEEPENQKETDHRSFKKFFGFRQLSIW